MNKYLLLDLKTDHSGTDNSWKEKVKKALMLQQNMSKNDSMRDIMSIFIAKLLNFLIDPHSTQILLANCQIFTHFFLEKKQSVK